jgi:hypothetical protein
VLRANYADTTNETIEPFGGSVARSRGAFPDQPRTDGQGRVTYGLYEQALPPRQVQLAAKFSF